MKDSASMHLKVQEMADCYATTDPLAEMAALGADEDKDQAAIKWLALAVLHGINDHAEKITIQKSKDGVTVKAKYRKTELPDPPADIGDRILKVVRDITHIEGDKGKMPLSLGIRDSSIELKLKIETKDDGEQLTIKFPDM